MLQTELAMLYFRHETEEDENVEEQKDIVETVYSFNDSNRKQWRRVKRKISFSSLDDIMYKLLLFRKEEIKKDVSSEELQENNDQPSVDKINK